MQDSSGCACICAASLLTFWLGLMAGGYLGDNTGREAVKREAIEHGAAEYVITDEPTGAVEFRWLEKP